MPDATVIFLCKNSNSNVLQWCLWQGCANMAMYMVTLKEAEFAKRADSDEVAHLEPSHLDITLTQAFEFKL